MTSKNQVLRDMSADNDDDDFLADIGPTLEDVNAKVDALLESGVLHPAPADDFLISIEMDGNRGLVSSVEEAIKDVSLYLHKQASDAVRKHYPAGNPSAKFKDATSHLVQLEDPVYMRHYVLKFINSRRRKFGKRKGAK